MKRREKAEIQPAANIILEVRDLTIRRGRVKILDALTWTVELGQHWVILGPNGSGKTSLLAALTGYLTPTDGTIHVLGAEYGATDWRELRQAVGLVSSSVRQLMHDEDSAAEIVAGGARAEIGYWGRLSKAQRASAEAALRRVEADQIVDRPWAVLSQGERQRVLIARALIAKPRLLILDEPCAGLDPVAREHFLGLVERLAREQDPGSPKIILVTHHVEEITPAFTHALLLRGGTIAANGPIARALTSGTLSATFNAPLRLTRSSGRFSLRLQKNLPPSRRKSPP